MGTGPYSVSYTHLDVYKRQFHVSPQSSRSINLSNVASALQSPNGMTLNWNKQLVSRKQPFLCLLVEDPHANIQSLGANVENHCAPDST